MRAISWDVWGTLLISNPQFKLEQYKLVKEYKDISWEDWNKSKTVLKKEADDIVEKHGVHLDRMDLYKKLLGLSGKDTKDFISYSNELFLKFPPILREPDCDLISILKERDYRVYISSNTVLIYGDILGQVIYDNFGIIKKNCNFSDQIGFSKPDEKMFKFPIKPDWHIGDNIITDAASEKFGIKHYHINEQQDFKTFIDEHL